MAAERRGSPATLALVVVFGIAVLGLVVYAMQLRSENARLATATPAAKPATPAAPAAGAPAAPAAAGTGRQLDESQRKAILDVLGTGESSAANQVWFATSPQSEAQAYQRQFAKVFQEAGWTIKGNAPVTFSIKAGLYVFIADEEEPDHVRAVLQALEAAGLEPVVGRGYREFYAEKKKENPNWNGFPMGTDQSYVIVVGPKPAA